MSRQVGQEVDVQTVLPCVGWQGSIADMLLTALKELSRGYAALVL
jgi:hypothetical protein